MVVLLVAVAAAAAAAAVPAPAAPWHWQLAGGNNVAGTKIGPKSSAPPVYYDVQVGNETTCQDACAANTSCRSFAWAAAAPEHGGMACRFASSCYFRTDNFWAPVAPTAHTRCKWTAGRKVFAPAPPPPPLPGHGARNILYVMVDDLRAQLGCYGHGGTVHTPNVDELARSGTLFQHAYVQIAVCSPSRSSYLTGLRPRQQNVLNFRTDFRKATADGRSIVTLPQWFKVTGYISTGLGKTCAHAQPCCACCIKTCVRRPTPMHAIAHD
jgi:hypothetical protein